MSGAADEPSQEPLPPPSSSSSSSSNNNMTNHTLHLYIDCTQGISARSFLDGLRALARTGDTQHSNDALKMDPLAAAIWIDHIPDSDRVVLEDHEGRVNPELVVPVQSWEPFRKDIRDSPVQVSQRAISQLKDLLDALKKYCENDDEVKRVSPLYPSVVWHMMAVVLLLDRLRIRSMSVSAVPQPAQPTVLVEILKRFPSSAILTATPTKKGEHLGMTTLDGAILLHILQPQSPISPDRVVFHGKATGRDGQIQTELGLTHHQTLMETSENSGGTASSPPPTSPKQPQAQPNVEVKTASVAPDQSQGPQQATSQQLTLTASTAAGAAAAAAAGAAAAGAHQSPQQLVALEQEKQTGGLESPLWNVERTLTLLQTNIDDMTAEHLAFCTELLMQQGAADVWLTPILMKKGRAAHELSCLAKDDATTKALLITIFRQTTTLGVRVWSSKTGLQRVSLRREMVTVEYCRRSVQVKVAFLGKEPVSLKPEYDQCAAISKETKIPLLLVTEEVKAMAKDVVRRQLLGRA